MPGIWNRQKANFIFTQKVFPPAWRALQKQWTKNASYCCNIVAMPATLWRMAFLCRKLCMAPLAEQDFLGDAAFTGKWYGGENNADGTGGGYHLLYIAEITDILVKD